MTDMAFWGIEVKPGRPYTHSLNDARGRLHLTQATLGLGSSTKKSIVQCNIGDKRPIFLCTLLPDKIESCSLDLEFEEEEEVTFSVLGPQSIHLAGIIIGDDQDPSRGGDYDSDSYGEDIAETETDNSTEYDTEDEYEDDFIDDDDLDMFPPSHVPNSGVVIEEISDDNKHENESSKPKQQKKKNQLSESRDDDDKSLKQIVVKSDNGVPVLESEDEDGFPISSQHKSKTDIQKNKKIREREIKKKKKAAAEDDDSAALYGGLERVSSQPSGSSLSSTEIVPESDLKERSTKKKKKKKRKNSKGEEQGNEVRGDEAGTTNKNDGLAVQPEAAHDKGINVDTENNVTEKKKKKKRKRKTEETDVGDGNMEIKEKKSEAKPSQVRTYANGLVIEELSMGRPDGKRASPGKKVSVHYIGRLQKSDKIFDSNIGRAPFQFRLGVGHVIKGWDVGVNGMRIGDKRRLTIPPSMGYGAKGAPPQIPQNAWLVFDVELVDVR